VFSCPPSEVDSLRAQLRRKHHIFHLSLSFALFYMFSFFIARPLLTKYLPTLPIGANSEIYGARSSLQI
jgi:hypothetical protein